MVSLWIVTDYLMKEGKNRFASLIKALPAAFMSAVTATYILMAGEGFHLTAMLAYHLGIGFGDALFNLYLVLLHTRKKKKSLRQA